MIQRILGAGLTFAAACLLAQTAPTLEFEAASIKPAAPITNGRMFVQMGGDPGRVNYSNVSLKDMIRQAYQLKDYQVIGPDWLSSERFDVVAKVPEGAKESDKPAMLQAMLAQRFHLTVHREKRDLPAYALVVAKGGPKLKEFVESTEASDGGGPGAGGAPAPPKRNADGSFQMPKGRGGMMMMGMGRLQGQGLAIQQLADMLTRQLNRPVVDETGLTGKYDISLNWAPEAGEGPMGMIHMSDGGRGEGRPVDAAVETAPPLTTAIQQQLGLRLESKKLPLEVVVVDHIEKTATEN